MNRFTKLFSSVVAVAFLVSALACANTHAQQGQAGESTGVDQTLSPYFLVKSDDQSLDQLPLKSTSANVNIAGVIADVRVSQVYKNEGKKALEAIYVFPASTRAAVYAMKMTIGKRVIEAKIRKREEARRDYEQARDQGKSASLLEQQRPNVFQMNVANIMPGDEIKVELSYTELLVPTDRVYEFVYPTVVGPRYSNVTAEQAPASERWVQNPYLHQGEKAPYSFDINVTIAAGMPIRDVSCPSHKVTTVYGSPSIAKIALDKSESNGGNRDYVVHYRLDGGRIQSGLLLSNHGEERFFLLMMQPPEKVAKAQIPGREYIFIVDVSGSMYGFPLDVSKQLLKNLIGNLRPTDVFNVLLFSGGSALMSEKSLPATNENIQKAINLIERQQGGGGTELLPALKQALALKKPENFSRTFVIVTDGYVSVEEEAFDLIRNNLDNANVFAFGIGSSVNRHLIEGMARVGMGEPFVILTGNEAAGKAARFKAMIESPVLTRVKVNFDGFDAYAVEPSTLPDVLAERPVIVFGKWRGEQKGTITLTGVTGTGKFREVVDVSKAKASPDNSALRYLWARHRISLLSDYNKLRLDDKRVNEVTELGLSYNLLTAYTSFVAIDSEIRNKDGKPTAVKQPLPLPEDVSDYAVGGNMMRMALAAPNPAEGELHHYESTPTKAVREREIDSKDKGKEKILFGVDDVTIVSGPLSKTEVASALQKHLPEIQVCYGKAKLQEKLVINLEIGPDGKVRTIKIQSPALKEKDLQKCLTEAAKKWRFARSSDAKATVVTVTFLHQGHVSRER
jgi:Ca-activated chloride channel family protein